MIFQSPFYLFVFFVCSYIFNFTYIYETLININVFDNTLSPEIITAISMNTIKLSAKTSKRVHTKGSLPASLQDENPEDLITRKGRRRRFRW